LNGAIGYLDVHRVSPFRWDELILNNATKVSAKKLLDKPLNLKAQYELRSLW
jgi:hypothetical protein